jgi:hypothetical protein
VSPDTIDSLSVSIIDLIESWPKGWADDDELHQQFMDLLHRELEPFCTRDRNYN